MTHNDSLKRALLVGFNLIVIVCLLLSANGFYLSDKRGLFGAGAANALVIPDNALVYNFKLTRLRVTDVNQAVVLDTQTGQVSGQAVLDGIRSGQVTIGPTTVEGDVRTTLWLLKSADQVLGGARVRLQIPLLGFDGQLAESSPGVYTVNLSDQLVLTPDFGASGQETLAVFSWLLPSSRLLLG